MAITVQAKQILWGAAVSQSIAAAGNALSAAMAIGQDAVQLTVQCMATNNGTAASGDKVTFYARYTVGDVNVNPDVDDDFDTASHAEFLFTLDTFAEASPTKTVSLNPNVKAVKIYAVYSAATNGITVSAQLQEKNAA